MIEIREAPSTNAVVIRCLGSGGAATVERCVSLALRVGQTDLVVDLGTRQDADAELLSVLRESARRVHAAAGRFAVVCTDSRLRRLFDMTLLSRGFPVYATPEDALAR